MLPPDLANLLRVVREARAGRARDQPSATDELEETDRPDPPCCIICGYPQVGGQFCPECGLSLSRFFHDPTAWAERPGLRSALDTAGRVLRFEDRLRLRTGMLGATPQAARFSSAMIAGTCVLFALGLAIWQRALTGPLYARAGLFAAHTLLAAVVFALTLFALRSGLARFLRMEWRPGFTCTPGAVHYATVWWLVTAAGVLLLALARVAYPTVPLTDALLFLLFLGDLAWMAWLASALVFGGYVGRPLVRVTLAAGLAVLLAPSLLTFVCGTAVSGVRRGLSLVGENGLTQLQLFGVLQPPGRPEDAQTFAVVVDVIPTEHDADVLRTLDHLGADRDARLILGHEQVSLANIREALLAQYRAIGPEDALIFYINGHGAELGSGAIQVANSERLTEQALRDLLDRAPTAKVLIVLDSCFAGKFLRGLDRKNYILITSTDDENLGYTCSLSGFWTALLDPRHDADRNGRVSVAEAFWGAYPSMLEDSEDRRKAALEVIKCRCRQKILAAGSASPQLVVSGRADPNDFATEVRRLAERPPETQPAQANEAPPPP